MKRGLSIALATVLIVALLGLLVMFRAAPETHSTTFPAALSMGITAGVLILSQFVRASGRAALVVSCAAVLLASFFYANVIWSLAVPAELALIVFNGLTMFAALVIGGVPSEDTSKT